MTNGGSDNTVNYGNVLMTPEEAMAHAQETMETEDLDNQPPWWMDETYNLARRVKRARAKAAHRIGGEEQKR